MGDLYNMSDYERKAEQHQNNLLNEHDDYTFVSDMEFEYALKIIVEERMVDISDDETIEALINSADEYRDFASCIVPNYEEATSKEIEYVYKKAKALIESLEDNMRASMRPLVEV